ncbi:MAG TPA: cytochrome c biogenesis protein ResB [Gemmatimonadales bacterium]|nr:cytochrome c biogenesis protein ResB [Gemmatimonadales bacterium]
MDAAPHAARPLFRAYRFLASLKLTLLILVTLAAILIAATWFSGYDLSVGALRRDLYGSWWFNVLLGLLMANLIACTVIRKPWRFWQWGFLVTHSGVLTLMIGAGISFNWKIYGDMEIPEGGSADSFRVEGERELVLASSDGEERRHALTMNPYVRSTPAKLFPLPAGLGALRVDEYIPNVAFDRVYEPAPQGRFDVIELKTYFADQDPDRMYLRQGETGGGALITFSYQGAEEALYRNLTEAAGEQGTLVITIGAETKAIDVREFLGKPVPVGGRTVTIREVFRSLTIGEGGRPEENPALPDGNPAAIFDVETAGRTESFYAFTLLPDHSPMRRGSGMHGSEAPDFAAAFRFVPRMSRVWIFAFPEGLRHVITTLKGPTTSGPMPLGGKIRHPSMPVEFRIEVSRRIEKAELTVRPEEVRKGRPPNPALRVSGTGPAAGMSEWLMFGEPVQLNLPKGTVRVGFQPRIYSDLGLTVELVRFKNPPHEGTGRASKFESDLRLHESGTGAEVTGTTGVNYPFSHKGWSFYQSAFNDRVQPVRSILQVSYDPGKPVLYLGCIMVVSGTLFMLFLKPLLQRLMKAAKSTSGAAFGPAATLATLVVLSAGTLGGMAALLSSPSLNGLLIGALVAASGVILAFATAGLAIKVSGRRPAAALELGRLVSLTWCLNTAALVLLMWTRVG